MRALGLILLPFCLAACDPAETADKLGRRSAETVVQPVVDDYMTGPQAETATRCIIDNASAAQIKALMLDFGTSAGPRTVQNVMAAATNPGAVACMASAGLPRLGGM